MSTVQADIDDFKAKILANFEQVELLFEISYCWKRCHRAIAMNEFDDYERYHAGCYTFLKGLAHYHQVKTVV